MSDSVDTIRGKMDKLVAVIVFFILLPIFALVYAVPVMLLWDWLMPTLFNLGTITLMQAWGLGFLANLLFGGPKASK
jgi:hypothetical protein